MLDDWLEARWILFIASVVFIIFGGLALLFSSVTVFAVGFIVTLLILSTLFLTDC